MATALELKQQQLAREAEQRSLIRGATGTIAQKGAEETIKSAMARGGTAASAVREFTSAGIMGTVINFVGALGIGAWQFLTQKKTAQKEHQLSQKQAATTDTIDEILNEINDVGNILVQDHGINPMTPEFEKIMADNLFKTIGYQGNCNMTAWLPKSTGDNRPVWFYAKQNGRVVEPINMETIPPNLSAYWYGNCQNLRDSWANAYAKLLLQQGRVQELEEFQKTRQRSITTLRIAFGIVFAILLFFVIKYGLAIK